MLTDYLNNMPVADREWFEPEQLAIIGAQALGQTTEEIQSDFPELSPKDFGELYTGIYEIMGAKQSSDAIVTYRACISGLVEYDTKDWDASYSSLGESVAIVYKARAAGYTAPEIGKLLPGSGKSMVNNAKARANKYFGSRGSLNVITCGFEYGLFARDV